MTEKTVVINGMVYDRRTGLPVRIDRATTLSRAKTAHAVHSPLQKSRTLHRKYVHLEKKQPTTPQHAPAATAMISAHKKIAPAAMATKHPDVHRIQVKRPIAQPSHKPVMQDIAPVAHHLVKKAEQHLPKPVTREIKPSHILKKEALHQATAAMPATRAKDVKQKHTSPRRRSLSIASAGLALILLGGYFTYLNMPSLSTRVAASQAGINAGYPAYQPSGYSLSGPVAYQQGNVSMKFAANAGPQSFTISQSKSGWDSSAVRENYIAPKVGDNYTTNSVDGLTIYTYQGNAAWVNKGILYTITGNAPLSTEQIEHIATSI
ncbi:DUF4367 domain-containing protein [Patescibacteria group bacterium]|nr:DUF4367 domain-containing protein [Patescibacteria group bacterium]